MRFTTFLQTCFVMIGLVTAASPTPPGLTYLYTVNITAGQAAVVGTGPRGNRIVVPIAGGTFAGPKLKGTVLPIGADWELLDSNGNITADVRQTFHTDDGANIQVFETGTSQPDGTAHVRLTYETGSSKYYWMNSIVAIGIIRVLDSSHITIDTWQPIYRLKKGQGEGRIGLST
ncbi:hypothetical protein QBC46DRAFT_440634 [Diplogelasinospora grovesii]|uniref:Uncharacterized protein n=1 Tax=Diplogelasinospora grovesii TaxID=303347 RepID=A0AAN6S8I1_9PEZI|nr:hypothetical protein QBC46DRAFT_440634 [Diplogelasinospora grovesii]